MTPQIAWLGLGNMGRGLAKNLAAKGSLSSPLIIYNRTPARAQEFQSKNPNTVVVKTVEEAVSKAGIVYTCVGDDAAIKELVKQIVSSGSVKNKIFVDCSTVHPDTTKDIASYFQEHGALFVASPVFGSPAMAEGGQVVCVLAGPREAVDQVKPFTTGVMAKNIIDFSNQEPAKASHLKVLGNTFIISMVETLSEGLVVAEKSGLGTDALHQFFEVFFPGPYVAYSTRMRTGDYYNRDEPLFAVDLSRKDVRHALDLANRSGSTMKGMELADSYMGKVKDHQGKKGDLAGIYGAVRQESGLKFENGK